MNNAKTFFAALAIMIMFVSATGCGKDEYDAPYVSAGNSSTASLSAPKLDKLLTTTDYDGVSFRVRFTNGGDVNNNMSCNVHWRQYASKPAKTPTAGDMTRHESMRQYGSGTKTKTTFDKAHAGFSGGTYIYYYFECSNSRYTTTTGVTYCVVKR